MTVDQLREALKDLDGNLPIAVAYDNHDYWGTLFHEANEVRVEGVQINGPKNADVQCVLITRRGY